METIQLFILGLIAIVILVPFIIVAYFIVKTVFEYYFSE